MLRRYLCNNKVIFPHDALNLIHSSMYEGLGYAGFTITARNALGQMAYKTVGRGKSTDLETLLVQTFPGKMSHGLQDHIMEGILGHPVSITCFGNFHFLSDQHFYRINANKCPCSNKCPPTYFQKIVILTSKLSYTKGEQFLCILVYFFGGGKSS